MVAIKVASAAGPCFGVRRALALVESLAVVPRAGRLVTLGPLIHNRREVERLRALGVEPVSETELLAADTVVVRTHGLPPASLRELRGRVARVVDATCPYVRSLQNLARRQARAGFTVILVGERGHPEVSAVLAAAAEETRASGSALAVSSAADLQAAAAPGRRLAVMAQTTQAPERLREVAAACLDRISETSLSRPALEVRVLDTICPCTRERRREAQALAAGASLVLVVGDRASANTRRLAELCHAIQPRTELVEGSADLESAWLAGVDRVAVIAGASTPAAAIDEVVARLRELLPPW